jgi:hypothetical protein
VPTQPLPEPDDVREVLNSLLGRDITSSRVPAESIPMDARFVVGLYEREDGKVGGVCVADLTIAVYSGAALSMLPVGVANENVKDGVIEDNLLENFHEVLNVGVMWFTGKGAPRVRLAEVFPPGSKLPDDVRMVMGAPAERLDVKCEVAGYGDGLIRLLATDF